MKKLMCPTELAYVFGVVVVALGAAMMEKAGFGVSMIVAPAYLIYRWLEPTWSFVSFGMAEYCVQALLLLVMICLLRKFRLSYLFSFVTAVLYGLVLDGFMALGGLVATPYFWQRILLYVGGSLACAAGVAMMFRTYISPEVYELFVKEVSAHFGKDIHRFKIFYDYGSLIVGLAMSFLIFGFGSFVGVSWGTVLSAVINGILIRRFSQSYDRHLVFRDALPFRKFFTDTSDCVEEA